MIATRAYVRARPWIDDFAKEAFDQDGRLGMHCYIAASRVNSTIEETKLQRGSGATFGKPTLGVAGPRESIDMFSKISGNYPSQDSNLVFAVDSQAFESPTGLMESKDEVRISARGIPANFREPIDPLCRPRNS